MKSSTILPNHAYANRYDHIRLVISIDYRHVTYATFFDDRFLVWVCQLHTFARWAIREASEEEAQPYREQVSGKAVTE